MSAVAWYNGTLGSPETMTVPLLDRAVFFGDGCYEACPARGTRPFALNAHFDRFYRSLTALSIPFCMDRDALKAILTACLAAANEPYAALYWQVSRATAPRVHAFPENDAKPNLLVTVTPAEPVPVERTMRLMTAEDVRYAMCDVKTLNLIPNVLACERAKNAGADEAVLIRDGFVTEGSHTNVLVLKDGTLFTHPTDNRILAGVTRAILLDLCRKNGVPVAERAFSADALFEADEVLVTSSTLGVRRVSEIDRKPVGGKAEQLFFMLRDAYAESFDGETNA